MDHRIDRLGQCVITVPGRYGAIIVSHKRGTRAIGAHWTLGDYWRALVIAQRATPLP